jgi:surfeit locus 1 family protein
MSLAWHGRVLLLVTLLGMLVTGRLGLWQLDRAERKLALQDSLITRGEAPPLAQDALTRVALMAPEQFHRRISLRGHWISGHTVFLDNRQMAGRPGFFVVTPMRLAAGDAILVQRGWIPRDLAQRDRLPDIHTPSGEVLLEGRVAPWPSALTEFGPDAPGPIRQNLHADAFAAEVGEALRPLSVVQLDGPGERPSDGLLREWPRPATDVHKHHGYAAQWFVFCAMIGSLYVWFQLIRPWRARRAA